MIFEPLGIRDTYRRTEANPTVRHPHDCDCGFPTYAHAILHAINELGEQLMTEANATQADIDALTAAVTTDRTAIATVVAQLNALIAAGQPVHVADLQAAVSGLTGDIAADAPPAPPAPPAA